ncbi:MAG: ATP-dependent DNA helicase RecG [Armatimonadetes bacterium]|nr:MAG: ATP-dependent DNA helicase RecG [Armatimonadota bacterium]
MDLKIFDKYNWLMNLNTPLSLITGIGPIYARRLKNLDLHTVDDLINHYPFRYDDFSQNANIVDAQIGEVVTIKGELWSIKNTYTRFRKVLTQAILNDGSGTVDIVWFNQPWLTKSLFTGSKIQVSGKINRRGNKTVLVSPAWERIPMGDFSTPHTPLHTGKLTAIYPETFGITSKWLRQKISFLLPITLPLIKESLPEWAQEGMITLPEAIKEIHNPTDHEFLSKAGKRLAFQELFLIQLLTQKRKIDWQKKQIIQRVSVDRKKMDDFLGNLPFKLTNAQSKVIEEIIQDIQKDFPMNRLLQGEVGSGKTVVAAVVSYLLYLNGLKTVVMAPTEILAFQHHQTFNSLFSPYGISTGIYTGSKKFTKEATPDIIIGTHALLSQTLTLDNIGLVIVDEQQRFGVKQRSFLRSRAKTPHFLTMTATPIPRTVALTLYGDLNLSVIDQLPVGRKQIRTHFVPAKKRTDAYRFIAGQIKQGRQIYIITPLIEQSETLTTVKAAKVEYERLSQDIFPQFRLGLLHGRLKSKEKETVINNFKEHKIDILVSTSVVEVGVDVPNATVMVIEGAERFGLAQLHQLRGRVGRGEEQSYAFLFTEEEIPAIVRRLKNLETINNGLKLAELDLKIRGAGEVFGTRQSGYWNLKIASFSDLPLIEKTQQIAQKMLSISPNLDKYPQLAAKLVSVGKEIFPD